MGCPVSIGDTKYERNALMFNLCFVFEQHVDTINHEPVVKKLASYLTQIEVRLLSDGLLSNSNSSVRLLSDGLLSSSNSSVRLIPDDLLSNSNRGETDT